MLMRTVVLFFVTLSIWAAPALALENENEAPVAFVEGTRDYAIPYLEKSLVELSKYFPETELRPLALAIADLKAQNAAPIKRIGALKANKTFLKEKGADLLRYRETLAGATDIMFSFFQRLASRTTLPPRQGFSSQINAIAFI